MPEQKTEGDKKMMRISITITPELYDTVLEVVSDVQKERHERFSVSQFVRESIEQNLEQHKKKAK